MQQLERDQSQSSKSFLERLSENNERSYFNKVNKAVMKNEERQRHLQQLIGSKTAEELETSKKY
jgi:type III secretory pathway component EscR